MHAAFLFTGGNIGEVVALGVGLIRVIEHVLRAKFDAQLAALASLGNDVNFATRRGDRFEVNRGPCKYLCQSYAASRWQPSRPRKKPDIYRSRTSEKIQTVGASLRYSLCVRSIELLSIAPRSDLLNFKRFVRKDNRLTLTSLIRSQAQILHHRLVYGKRGLGALAPILSFPQMVAIR